MAEPQVEPQAPDQRIYTRDFKLEAVRLSESSKKMVAQISSDLGVPERVLDRWRHELREQHEHRDGDHHDAHTGGSGPGLGGVL